MTRFGHQLVAPLSVFNSNNGSTNALNVNNNGNWNNNNCSNSYGIRPALMDM